MGSDADILAADDDATKARLALDCVGAAVVELNRRLAEARATERMAFAAKIFWSCVNSSTCQMMQLWHGTNVALQTELKDFLSLTRVQRLELHNRWMGLRSPTRSVCFLSAGSKSTRSILRKLLCITRVTADRSNGGRHTTRPQRTCERPPDCMVSSG
jgi:hypothetical protein